LLSAAGALVSQHGWRALYRGNLTNVARSAPQKALDFFAFDHFKTALTSARANATTAPPPSTARRTCMASASAARWRGGARRTVRAQAAPEGAAPQLGPGGTLAAAGLAGAASNIVLYPLEVVRTRLCADGAGVYKGMGDAMSKIARTEGVPALYRCAQLRGWKMHVCHASGTSTCARCGIPTFAELHAVFKVMLL
jgi:solute carrier family 25 (mitochondrial phosphate transporter), member 23/24/25/41